MTYLIQFIISFASTVGFGIITNIPSRALPTAGLTGGTAWTCYIFVQHLHANVFLANMTAAIIIGLLGNWFAIRKRVPVNMIYIPSLVSLVPGGTIYLAMKNFSLGHYANAQAGVITTVTIAVALAVGFVLAEVIVRQIKQHLRSRQQDSLAR